MLPSGRPTMQVSPKTAFDSNTSLTQKNTQRAFDFVMKERGK